MAADPTPERLYFEETDGKRRRVTLVGYSAPFGHFRAEAAFEEGGEVRRSLHRNPGENVPDVHVTGTSENDLVVRGHLRDSLGAPHVALGLEAGQANYARGIKDAIEAIRVAGRQLRIVWVGGLAGGMLTKTKFPREAEGEWGYELTFDIYWRGSSPRRKLRKPVGVTVGASAIDDAWLAAGSGADALKNVPGMSLGVAEHIDAIFAAAAAQIGALMSLVANLEAGAADLAGSARSLADRCASILERGKELVGFFHALPEPDDAANAAAWRKAHADTLQALYDAIAKAYELGIAAETNAAQGSSRSVYVARDGDTVDQIAMRFGVTITALRAANPTLPLGRIPAGTRVAIPGS